MAYVLKDQSGRVVGSPIDRYADAFNHRASLNRPDLRVVEMSEDDYRQWRVAATRKRAQQIADGTLPEAMRPSAGIARMTREVRK